MTPHETELAKLIEDQAKKIRRLETENRRLKIKRYPNIKLIINRGGQHHGKN